MDWKFLYNPRAFGEILKFPNVDEAMLESVGNHGLSVKLEWIYALF